MKFKIKITKPQFTLHSPGDPDYNDCFPLIKEYWPEYIISEHYYISFEANYKYNHDKLRIYISAVSPSTFIENLKNEIKSEIESRIWNNNRQAREKEQSMREEEKALLELQSIEIPKKLEIEIDMEELK